MRLGVLGGSFNPPHVGHLLIAGDAFESLGLDLLMVIPASANPLKAIDESAARPDDRLQMVRLAFGGDSRFEVSAMEIDRGGLSYMVDTLETLAARNPGAELVLLVGMDSIGTLDRWKSPERVRELATLAVLARSEADGALDSIEGGNRAHELPVGAKTVTARRIDVSSTEIRSRVAAGMSIKGFVAESVERYIFAAKLYGSGAASA